VLNVGYAETGSEKACAVILLHGWPYDIHSFVDVAPLLASKEHRVIIPYLRGYGTTTFLSNETLRNGQQAVVAVDTEAVQWLAAGAKGNSLFIQALGEAIEERA